MRTANVSTKWHYTTRMTHHLGSILASGILLREGETPGYYAGVKPFVKALWFSTNPVFEQTALKIFSGKDSSERRVECHLALGARIAVAGDMAPISWYQFKLMELGSPRLARNKRRERREGLERMESAGRSYGATPDEWWCSLDRVPSSQWLSLEIYVAGRWIAVDPDKSEEYIYTGGYVEDDVEKLVKRFGTPVSVAA